MRRSMAQMGRLLMSAWLLAPGLAAADPEEYQIKAAFLYNFARLVDWPRAPAGPVVIAILGQDPFGEVLDRAINGKTIGGRPLIVRRQLRTAELKDCRILFVASSEKKRVAPILSGLRGAAVLTIGEFEGFLEQGGGVNFTVENDRVRFDVNLRAAREAGLQISARLLNLARLVKE